MMSTYTLVVILTFVSGASFGATLVWMFGRSHADAMAERSEHATHMAHAKDAELVTYLDKSECSLFYHPVLSAWGLIDGNNTLIATAHNVRNTLTRAMDNDRKLVAPQAIPAHVMDRGTKEGEHVPA